MSLFHTEIAQIIEILLYWIPTIYDLQITYDGRFDRKCIVWLPIIGDISKLWFMKGNRQLSIQSVSSSSHVRAFWVPPNNPGRPWSWCSHCVAVIWCAIICYTNDGIGWLSMLCSRIDVKYAVVIVNLYLIFKVLLWYILDWILYFIWGYIEVDRVNCVSGVYRVFLI